MYNFVLHCILLYEIWVTVNLQIWVIRHGDKAKDHPRNSCFSNLASHPNGRFFHGDLQEEVYMKLLPGATAPSEYEVYRLWRSISLWTATSPTGMVWKNSNILFVYLYTKQEWSVHVSSMEFLYDNSSCQSGWNHHYWVWYGWDKAYTRYISCSSHMKDIRHFTYFPGLEVHALEGSVFFFSAISINTLEFYSCWYTTGS